MVGVVVGSAIQHQVFTQYRARLEDVKCMFISLTNYFYFKWLRLQLIYPNEEGRSGL